MAITNEVNHYFATIGQSVITSMIENNNACSFNWIIYLSILGEIKTTRQEVDNMIFGSCKECIDFLKI